MKTLLFYIELKDGTVYDFNLYAENEKHARDMMALMSSAVYEGELEMPDTLMWASETLH